MTHNDNNLHKSLTANIRKNLLSGVFITVPFVVSLLIIRWLFDVMSGFLKPALRKFLPQFIESYFGTSVPDAYIHITVAVLSVVLLVLLLYFVGVTGQLVIGKKMIKMGEEVFMQIPIVRTVFSSTRQVMKSISMPDRTMFKSVVLVEFPCPGIKAIGFLTGFICDNGGNKFAKILIPTAPNPTTGFFELIPVKDIVQTNISIEDGFKMIISGGVVSPDTFDSFELKPDTQNGSNSKGKKD